MKGRKNNKKDTEGEQNNNVPKKRLKEEMEVKEESEEELKSE